MAVRANEQSAFNKVREKKISHASRWSDTGQPHLDVRLRPLPNTLNFAFGEVFVGMPGVDQGFYRSFSSGRPLRWNGTRDWTLYAFGIAP